MKHWRTIGVIAVVVWIGCVAIWATQPMTVTVKVGTNPGGADKTATVQCDSPLSGNHDPTSALPDLHGGESFSSPPCESALTTARNLFLFDGVIAAVAVVLLVLFRRRDHSHDDDAESDPATTVAT